ncbi:MAG TPA: VTT domain-containing protein [Thermoanaerobaculia bacterium]|nr:VTT domain-containing protein [Thermoanaerobaculia bacterium]
MTARTAVRIAVVVIIAGAVIAVLASPLRHQLTISNARALVASERAHVQSLWWTPFVLIAAYGIGCIFAIPASLFIAVAGALWGWKAGLAYAMAGGMLGASLSYFLGRYLGEGLLERFGKAGAAVKRQIERAGFRTMLIIRLIPGPPFAMWNYGAGVARFPFGIYFLATLLGTLPAHFVFVYSADALFSGTMTERDALKTLAEVGALLIALTLIPTIIKRFMKPRADAVRPYR